MNPIIRNRHKTSFNNQNLVQHADVCETAGTRPAEHRASCPETNTTCMIMHALRSTLVGRYKNKIPPLVPGVWWCVVPRPRPRPSLPLSQRARDQLLAGGHWC